MDCTSGARLLKRRQSSSSCPKQEGHDRLDARLYHSSRIDTPPVHGFFPGINPDKPQETKNPGIISHFPPSHSHTMSSRSSSHQLRSSKFGPAPSHSRSLSQPLLLEPDSFLCDAIPMDFSKEELHSASNDVSIVSNSTWTHKGHVRSNSDIPYGFFTHSSPQLISQINSLENLNSLVPGLLNSGQDSIIQSTKRESYADLKSEKEMVDDLFSTYLNLENLGSLDRSCDSSDNASVDCIRNENPIGVQDKDKARKEICERDNVIPKNRHFRSVSMDSFMGTTQFSDESPMPSSPLTQLKPKIDVASDDNSDRFKLEMGNGVFSAAELEKIMANERLIEIASCDPRRAKRILANRQSAARSKERKTRYISELEYKVQTLQTEATTLSTQVTLLQRDTTAIVCQNNELKFRIQSMEQQGQLKDALNETLTVEVQRLRLASLNKGEGKLSNVMNESATSLPPAPKESKWQRH